MVILSENRLPTLLSYKYFLRPTFHKLCGRSEPKTKHQQNMQEIIRLLALHGPLTTWDMAKISHGRDSIKLRTKEKEFRRLLRGRIDRGQYSQGMLDLNLVSLDALSTKRNPGNTYRLSIFGILYCLDSLNLKNNEIDILAKNYELLIPLVFGKWGFLKSTLGDHVYLFTMLGKGLLFDNPNLITIKNPTFYELITFFNIKSNLMSQSLTEQKIGELAALWFYISLLYLPNLTLKKSTKNQNIFLMKILRKDNSLNKWFHKFLSDAHNYYKARYNIIDGLSIF